MNKLLLQLDIEQKIDRLNRSCTSNFGLFVMVGVVIVDVILILIATILRITENVTTFYLSTIPIVILMFYNVAIGVRLNIMSKRSNDLRRKINKELQWLTDYDKVDEDRLYDQFIEISEAKLPPKRR